MDQQRVEPTTACDKKRSVPWFTISQGEVTFRRFGMSQYQHVLGPAQISSVLSFRNVIHTAQCSVYSELKINIYANSKQ